MIPKPKEDETYADAVKREAQEVEEQHDMEVEIRDAHKRQETNKKAEDKYGEGGPWWLRD